MHLHTGREGLGGPPAVLIGRIERDGGEPHDVRLAGVGEHLTRALAEHFAALGRTYVDLSVLHDNRRAISLYERVGFVRVPVLALKRKNTINERLFVGPPGEDYQRLNPYARIVADEARRFVSGVLVVDNRMISLVALGEVLPMDEGASAAVAA